MDLNKTEEDTQRLTPERQAPLIRKTINDRKGITVPRWLGYLILTEDYLESLADDTILARAISPKRRKKFAAMQQSCEESYRDLLARANAFVGRLGESYRGKLHADIVRQTVRSIRPLSVNTNR